MTNISIPIGFIYTQVNLEEVYNNTKDSTIESLIMVDQYANEYNNILFWMMRIFITLLFCWIIYKLLPSKSIKQIKYTSENISTDILSNIIMNIENYPKKQKINSEVYLCKYHLKSEATHQEENTRCMATKRSGKRCNQIV